MYTEKGTHLVNFILGLRQPHVHMINARVPQPNFMFLSGAAQKNPYATSPLDCDACFVCEKHIYSPFLETQEQKLQQSSI